MTPVTAVGATGATGPLGPIAGSANAPAWLACSTVPTTAPTVRSVANEATTTFIFAQYSILIAPWVRARVWPDTAAADATFPAIAETAACEVVVTKREET